MRRYCFKIFLFLALAASGMGWFNFHRGYYEGHFREIVLNLVQVFINSVKL